MPSTPVPGRQAVPAMLADFERRLAALETQQQQVVTDPTGATGDPAHGHATMVIGNLLPVTGVAAFGVAVWNGTAWTQILPTGAVCSVYRATAASIAANAVVPFDTKVLDPYAWFDTATNRFTPKIAGYYDISAACSGPAAIDIVAGIFKNGSLYAWGSLSSPGGTDNSRSVVDALVSFNGSTDFVEVRLYNNSGTIALNVGSTNIYFNASFTSRA